MFLVNREELCFNEGVDKTLAGCGVKICFQEYSFQYVETVAKTLGRSVLNQKKGKCNCGNRVFSLEKQQ